jgi:hypothetical protein
MCGCLGLVGAAVSASVGALRRGGVSLSLAAGPQGKAKKVGGNQRTRRGTGKQDSVSVSVGQRLAYYIIPPLFISRQHFGYPFIRLFFFKRLICCALVRLTLSFFTCTFAMHFRVYSGGTVSKASELGGLPTEPRCAHRL